MYGISSFCTLSENNSFLHGKISCFCIFLAENGVFNTNRSPRVADGIRNEPRYTCSDDILYCLGEMYAGGEQFTQGIDNADGKDTSEFVFRAIEIYCKNKN